ncbi:MAG: altronate dehydratase [Clostridia bacterium]|nr:altronate dehydratase [Clostridia bacterium]
MEYVVINERDNVKISLEDGHKYARRDIHAGENVIRYGYPIGTATKEIRAGEHVHCHNLVTALSGCVSYEYHHVFSEIAPEEPFDISAYLRENDEIGIRNDIWIIPTVGCVNGAAREIARQTGALAFEHPYGCSQLGDDHEFTRKILCGLIRHPNAGGVLVLGLGCENNRISELKEILGDYNEQRVRFLNTQDCFDETAEGVRIIHELRECAQKDRRVPVSVSKLRVGLKCGGSDGLSGITANPLVGKITDKIVSFGGTAVLTEVPEMFGAEQILMNRCVDRELFEKTVSMIDSWKEYYISHGQPVSENPSPGNRDGGITTLEEKSLGCVQKGGRAPVTAVLDCGDIATKGGLNLLNGPGNDLVAITNLTAAGCHLILFTTGRGTPLGAPVPTVKIATNSTLSQKKPHWIDFDAYSGNTDELFRLMLDVVEGRQTRNELNGFREIAIFKNGVTL